jgi:ATP-dependent DNA helicase UvrD/PcrA
VWYDPILDLLYDDSRPRRSDLDQLGRMAAQHPSRSSFLTDLTLDPPEACGGEAGVPIKDEDWLVLSTIHSAKGQEWRAVFILNVVDGCIPSDLATGTPEEIDEERRLLYVAMTRARDDLVLMQPLRFFMRGQARGGDAHVCPAQSIHCRVRSRCFRADRRPHLLRRRERNDRTPRRQHRSQDQDARNMALMTLRNDPSAAN